MKNDLIKYLEYEKSGLNVNEEDFLRILNKMEALPTPTPSPSFVYRLKSPLFAWGFGFSGMVAALFMFILTDVDNVNTNNTSPNIVAYTKVDNAAGSLDINTEPSLTQNKTKAIMTIDSIDSFANINIE